jgi:hypothetical protein
MNTTHHRSAWGIALASVALAFTTACGSEVTPAPANIGDPVGEQSSPAPRDPCFGSADYAERACADKGAGGGSRTSGSGFGPQ